MQSLFSDVTHLHFCICLVSQVNPVIDWERTTQGWEYQEMWFTWGHLEGWLPYPLIHHANFLHMIWYSVMILWVNYLACVHFLCAAAAAKSLRLCLTLFIPIDSSPPVSPFPGILHARTLEWVAISFSNVRQWKVKVKSLSHVWPSMTPWTAAFFSILVYLVIF